MTRLTRACPLFPAADVAKSAAWYRDKLGFKATDVGEGWLIFDLPEADVEHLAARGLLWETLVVAKVRWLILHEFPVPAGYNHTAVKAALRIEPGYPDTQIDMVYFHPALARKDGRRVNALAPMRIARRQWQRWSRHRTPTNPWRPGEDGLATHLLLVEDWLRREFDKEQA